MSNRQNPPDKPSLLQGKGVRRDLKEAWGSIRSKVENSEPVESNNPEARLVKIERLQTNPNQPRRQFDPERESELAEDIKERGILEPLIVRLVGEDDGGAFYQIIAGERRYRAAGVANLSLVPVIVKNYSDKEAQFASLVENLQRVDLDKLDEAGYFKLLVDEYNYSYRDIAGLIHRSPAYVSDRIKLLIEIDPNSDAKEPNSEKDQDANDSEILHKRSENRQKLHNSQSTNENRYLKPVLRFRDFVDKTHTRLDRISTEERTELLQQVKELQQQLQVLEKAINSEQD